MRLSHSPAGTLDIVLVNRQGNGSLQITRGHMDEMQEYVHMAVQF